VTDLVPSTKIVAASRFGGDTWLSVAYANPQIATASNAMPVVT
jgi:hypothetical protein